MIAKGIHLAYANNVLYIDGKANHSIGASCRYVFAINDDLVLKTEKRYIDDDCGACWKQCKTEAEALARIKPKDQQYFPFLYATGVLVDEDERRNDVDGITWILVENIQFDLRAHTWAEAKLVKKLATRYDIGDICASADSQRNWGINAKTNKPIIFDVGMSRSL